MAFMYLLKVTNFDLFKNHGLCLLHAVYKLYMLYLVIHMVAHVSAVYLKQGHSFLPVKLGNT